ncbi:hypothetical protein [Micromonospora sp. CB01531]|uniref:hypothetical protein n=1 Tax=Micromonospora sp. CB01531 TaxID=1718947 RepID=UPI00093BCB94|nr:hypothetical protein [Micromonospora sp. CB01531]OKI89136.1 hypothetical protein A6A27_00040 [Micromonospora sp. CB01531]
MPALRRALRHAWRCSWAVLALVLTGALAPAPASAHPFGAPQQLNVAGEGDHVRVRWLVGGTDDLTQLGIALGVLPQDRVLLDGAVIYEPADAVALAEAPAFANYLTERITVNQDGRACQGEASVADDLAADGAEVLFTCPEPVNTVTVTSRMLTDLHEAYRTLARGPRGQKAVYDATHESADWTISDDNGTDSHPASTRSVAATPASSSAVQLSVVGGVLLAVVAAGAFWYRRRGRKA